MPDIPSPIVVGLTEQRADTLYAPIVHMHEAGEEWGEPEVITDPLVRGIIDRNALLGLINSASTLGELKIALDTVLDLIMQRGDALITDLQAAPLYMLPIADAPVNTVLPSITGHLWVGETLTLSIGTWDNVLSYAVELRHVSDDSVIDTFTGDDTYIIQVSDENDAFYLHVTAFGLNGTITEVSANTGLVFEIVENIVISSFLDTTPDVSWDSVPNATTYTVHIIDDDDVLVYENLTATSPVTISPALVVADGPFRARIRANPGGAWAEYTFIVATYALRDEFTTAATAPVATPRTSEPGPGTLAVIGTASAQWQIAGGILDTTASSSSGLPYTNVSAGYTRATGLTFKTRVAQNPIGPGPNETVSPLLGWSTSSGAPSIPNITGLIYFNSSSAWGCIEQNVTTPFSLEVPAVSTFYDYAFVLRGTGAFSIIGDKLTWVHKVGSQGTMYPIVGQLSANRHPPRIDYMRVAQLGGAWADDYGIVTTRLAGARSVGNTFVHQAGGQIIEFVLDALPSAGEIDVRFRVQDTNNYWAMRVSSAGTLTLVEVVAGTPATRITLTGNQAADRLVCMMDGARARLSRVWAGAGTSATPYTSVSTFTTQTNGEVVSFGTGGGISNLEAWPRTLTGEMLKWISDL